VSFWAEKTPAMTPLFNIVVVLWVASELAVMVIRRARGGTSSGRDRGSLLVLWGLITASTVAASMLRGVRATRIGSDWAFWIGMALIVLGIIVRWVAIVTLRRYFTVSVAIQEGHQIIDHGIYRWVRHPSYSGSILSFAGLGLAMGNWLSLAVILLGTLIGFSYRISVEERALTEHFGERYRDYARRTKRLLPGVF
jgi:protein-S-isoprenylcysteine O-methyltransferase Ste14